MGGEKFASEVYKEQAVAFVRTCIDELVDEIAVGPLDCFVEHVYVNAGRVDTSEFVFYADVCTDGIKTRRLKKRVAGTVLMEVAGEWYADFRQTTPLVLDKNQLVEHVASSTLDRHHLLRTQQRDVTVLVAHAIFTLDPDFIE
eukprot:TRINITY_DN3451_c0_g1_i2.p1 TRINITY_DN3451_c0_g1~~TRINITY_DN3451_c0_g1_i2.p1  ORF type:complete len:143 (-),score=36.39 TRINITY_DN3451_c0_g1_i2:9-437(-)